MTKDRGDGGTLGGGDVVKEEEVPLVDGVFKGALGALGDEMMLFFGNGSSSGCHGGLWWLIEDKEDGEVDLPKSVQALWVRIADASEMKIHNYDGRKLMRQSDGLFHDHFEVDGLVLEQVDV
ncbi:hypothetical protein Tco_1173922 [Tanacetum coccineum]